MQLKARDLKARAHLRRQEKGMFLRQSLGIYAPVTGHVDTSSSNNKLARRATSTGRDGVGYRSAGSAYEDREPLPRRSFRSARSLNGSTSGPARILGNVFGNTLSRPSSPDKFFQLEKQTKSDKRKG